MVLNIPSLTIFVLLLAGLAPLWTVASDNANRNAETDTGDYVFAWPFIAPDTLPPRGGTTRGPEVDLAEAPSKAWQRVRAPGLDAFERDRAAILALAGDYRTSFDFLETIVFSPKQDPARPYRSWATERVHVLDDSGNYISLQHIIVMFYADADGNMQGPVVQKHWRQDWRYEPDVLLVYAGDQRWERRNTSPEARSGAWSQTVYQVDDTPRYASLGRWQHNRAFSTWEGNETLRPLPRRESTVRDDYDALKGINRITVLPGGWVHEQDNLKHVFSRDATTPPYLAREIGVDRYERITGFDFSAGDRYWRETKPYWAAVRAAWRERLANHRALRIADTCQDTPAFAEFFEQAEAARKHGDSLPETLHKRIEATLDCIVTPVTRSK